MEREFFSPRLRAPPLSRTHDARKGAAQNVWSRKSRATRACGSVAFPSFVDTKAVKLLGEVEVFNGPLLFRGALRFAGCSVRSTIASPRDPNGVSRVERASHLAKGPAGDMLTPTLHPPSPFDPIHVPSSRRKHVPGASPFLSVPRNPIPGKPPGARLRSGASRATLPSRVRRDSPRFDVVADPPPHFFASNRAASCPSCTASEVNLCRYGTSSAGTGTSSA